jgi:hypothetical protein
MIRLHLSGSLLILVLFASEAPLSVASVEASLAGVLPCRMPQKSPAEQLNENVERLITLSELVSRLELENQSTPEQTENVIASIEDVIRTLDFIRRDIGAKRLILSDEAVAQLNGFAQLLVSILSQLDKANPKLSPAHQKTVHAIATDVAFRMSRITESKGPSTGAVTTYPEVRVVVRTVRSDGTPEPNLRVYYLGEVYFDSELANDNRKTFDRLTSPSSDREIPEGYYRIWAGRGLDPEPVSEVKALQAIRPSSGGEIIVDLIVIK